MLKTIQTITELITPAKVDYYYLETGFRDQLGIWNGSVDAYIESLNGFKSPTELKAKLGPLVKAFEEEFDEFTKLDLNERDNARVLKVLKQKIEFLKSTVIKSGNYLSHKNIISNQQESRDYIEGASFNDLRKIHGYLEISLDCIDELDLIVNTLSPKVKRIKNEAKLTGFILPKPFFGPTKIEDLYKCLHTLQLIEKDKTAFNSWFSNFEKPASPDKKQRAKIKWTGNKNALIYFIRYIIPETDNPKKWITAKSVFEFVKDPELDIGLLVNRNDGLPSKPITETLSQFIQVLPQKK